MTYSKKHFVLVVAYLYVLLFVYAAVSKLLDFETFTLQLAQSPLLSSYAVTIAWLVPGVEILISIFLMIPRFRHFALYASYLLMVMFTTYIIIILNFSDFIPCSCGGVLEKLGWGEHLIFNIVFIVLASLAILFTKPSFTKRKLLVLVILAVVGISVVALLFAFSEKKMHRNNAFQRRYLPHPIEKIGEYNLKSNSYYIAGISDDIIYLGNYTAPLYLKLLDTTLNVDRDFRVAISDTGLAYSRAIISVNPPYFYLGDGNVPIIFRGKIKDWKAIPLFYKDAYFTQFKRVDSATIGFVTLSSKTASNALGLLKKDKEALDLKLDIHTLGVSTHGKFETDGSLLWNSEFEKFIYLYYYKNEYKIFNKALTYEATGKTIDTINTPILDIAYNTKKDEFKVGGKSVLVNGQSATCGNYLYIHSDRLGKYENDKILNTASIIDVYNIIDYSYEFSFYLFHQKDEGLTEFQVNKDLMVVIVGDKLWIYRLKPVYFNTGSDPTHTAQYQD